MIGANRGMYYWKLPKQKKTLLIRKIVDFVASAGSRFLAQKKSGSNQEWYDIGFCQSCKVVAALLKRDGDGAKNQDKQVEDDDDEEEFDFSELEEQKSKFDELGSSKFVVPPHIQKWYYPPQKESPPQSQRDNSRPVYQHSKGNSGWYSYGSSYYPYPHYPPASYSHPYICMEFVPSNFFSSSTLVDSSTRRSSTSHQWTCSFRSTESPKTRSFRHVDLPDSN